MTLTIEQLVKVFEAGRYSAWDGLSDGDIAPTEIDGKRAGIRAVVAALRDEMGQSLSQEAGQECCGRGIANRYNDGEECCNTPDLWITIEQLNKEFDEILGDVSTEALAKSDPSVCEWTKLKPGAGYEIGVYRIQCCGFRATLYEVIERCTQCGKPISFKENDHE